MNSAYHTAPEAAVEYVPLKNGNKFYVVDLTSMNVAGTNVGNSGYGRTIVDSGTTYSYFPSKIFRAMRNQLYSKCNEMKTCGSRRGSECWSSPGTTLQNIDTKFPLFDLTISGKK